MKVTVNGELTEIEDGIAIPELLKVLDVEMPDMVTVEHNGEILERPSFDSTVVSDGDKIEFLYFMGGGMLVRPKHGDTL